MLKKFTLGRHSITTQQVSNVDLLDVVYFDPATGQVHETRNTSHVQRKAFQQPEDFSTTPARRRRYGQQQLLSPRSVDHLLYVFSPVNLQTRDHSVCDAFIIINKSHRAHDSPHPQCRNQLIASRACTINHNPGQSVIAIGKRHMLCRCEPVPEKVLTHTQAQPAQHDQAQPPVVEDDRTRHHILMVAVPVHDHGQNQR